MSKSNETLGWKELGDDIETLAIHESYNTKKVITNCVAVPIVTSAIYALTKDEGDAEGKPENEWEIYTHSRHGCPTRDALEKLLAKVEGCKFALAFSSGCAAMNTILQTVLSSGSHVISMETIYSGTTSLFKDYEKFGIKNDYVQGFTEVEDQILSLLNSNTKIIWLETPANPTLQIVDLDKIVKTVRAKSPDVIIICDNTFLTPIFQRPLDFGVDIVIHSCSKYFGGHADLVMGSLATNSENLYTRLRHSQEDYGAIPSSFDSYLLLRSLKTLPIRMKQHSKTALEVARFLETHPKVEKVVHPGLESHPQHKLALKQQFGHSGALGFYIRGATLKESNQFLSALKIVLYAPSLGADISIANLPSKRSHSEISKEERERQGITDNYVRLSVGLESSASLIQDLNQALTFV